MNNLLTTLARLIMASALALLVAGCMVGPNYQPPDATAPSAWVGVTAQASAAPSMATDQTPSMTAWWHTFNDPQLTALVDETITANIDLQLAAARLRQARAARGVPAVPVPATRGWARSSHSLSRCTSSPAP